jgi:hypothetical protein
MINMMKLSEAIEVLQKMDKCWDGCPPDATDCKKCPFLVNHAPGQEAIKTALVYLVSIEEKEDE